MNINKFKEIAVQINKHEEKFRAFRIRAKNCYDRYIKTREIAYRELPKYNLDYEWKEVGYDSIVEVCNGMGIEVDEQIKNKKLCHDDDTDCCYYHVTFDEIYQIIDKLEDDIEFTFSILMLAKNTRNESELYREFICKIYECIRQSELEECLTLFNENQVFVAMWFDRKMKEAREKIESAIQYCGYHPMLIDVKEYNGEIVPEIYKAIEESTFVVADLTGQRGGVYYEAGYAKAKGKQVILTCCKEESTHFDVAQINTIYWKDKDDLYNRLVNRISATIGIIR